MRFYIFKQLYKLESHLDKHCEVLWVEINIISILSENLYNSFGGILYYNWRFEEMERNESNL